VHSPPRNPLCSVTQSLHSTPPLCPQWARCPRRRRCTRSSPLICSPTSPCRTRALQQHHQPVRLNPLCTLVQPPLLHLPPSWRPPRPPPPRLPLLPPRPIMLSVWSAPLPRSAHSRNSRPSSAAVREKTAKNMIRPLPVVRSQRRQSEVALLDETKPTSHTAATQLVDLAPSTCRQDADGT